MLHSRESFTLNVLYSFSRDPAVIIMTDRNIGGGKKIPPLLLLSLERSGVWIKKY